MEVLPIITKKIICAAAAALLCCGLPDVNAFAVISTKKYSIKFLGFNNELLYETEVEKGGVIDYDAVDTDSLQKNINKYTEVRFSAWDYNEKYASKDVEIHALSETATISLVSEPKRREFFSKKGDIDLDGLKVSITLVTQKPEKDASGLRKTEKKVVNIESICTATPSTLDEAFRNGDTATVNIFPEASVLPILTYDISYFGGLGDIDSDGIVDSSDASIALSYYAQSSTGAIDEIDEDILSRGDVDRNESMDSSDASFILRYYAENAVGAEPDWEEMVFSRQ